MNIKSMSLSCRFIHTLCPMYINLYREITSRFYSKDLQEIKKTNESAIVLVLSCNSIL